ncbi:MAG: hypothetical protein CL840_17725 [Crocinitomicaceae bacterium]|nr:hypothetical protein [Crocinitomicaceae bacterium]|tara:strand:- start:18375 stop:20936 length:2562 start_codon:yes stop_codon:yes gene_type:complete
MKQLYILLSGFCILLLSYFFLADNQARLVPEEIKPQPTSPGYSTKNSEHEGDELAKKTGWYESIHITNNGINWRQMDLNYRLNYQSTGERSDSGKPKGDWIEKGAKNQAGRIVYAIYDKELNTMKVASAGGIIWSTDLDSIQWKATNDHFRIDGIIALSEFVTNGKKRLVVASSYGRVFYSDDSSKTWTEATGLPNLNASGTIRKMVTCADSSLLVFGKEWDSDAQKEIYNLYYSNNGATSFTSIKKFNPVFYGPFENLDLHSIANDDSVAFFYFRDSIAEISGKTGLFNYTKPANPLLWGEVMLTGCRVGDSLKLYANVREFIYSSDGKANNWTHRGILKEKAFTSNSMSYSLTDTATVLFGGIELFTTRNGGSTWKKVNDWTSYYDNPEDSLHADIPFIGRFEKKDKSEFHLIGTDGGLYVSYDQLKSVKNISLTDHLTAQYYSILTNKQNEDLIYAGSQDQGFQRTTDDTLKKPLSFDQIVSGDFGHLSSSDSGKSIWMSNPEFIGYFANAKTDTSFAATWDFTDSFIVSHWLPPIIADPVHPNKAYFISAYKKGDPDKKSIIVDLEFKAGKIEWATRTHNFNIDQKKEEYLSALGISPINDTTWYAITNKGNFYYSFDRGYKWNRSSFFAGPGPEEMYGSCIYASKSNENDVYVSGSGYVNAPVYYSWNKGRDWRSISDSLPSTLVYKVTGNENDSILFAATEVGPFAYTKTDNRWFSLSDGSNPDQVYWDVEYLPRKRLARFVTYGRGIWDYELKEKPKDTTDVVEHHAEKNSLFLFPNPCNHQIMISGVDNENTTYRVYSIRGELVLSGIYNSAPINTRGLKPGNYLFILYSDGDSPQMERFIKLGE